LRKKRGFKIKRKGRNRQKPTSFGGRGRVKQKAKNFLGKAEEYFDRRWAKKTVKENVKNTGTPRLDATLKKKKKEKSSEPRKKKKVGCRRDENRNG